MGTDCSVKKMWAGSCSESTLEELENGITVMHGKKSKKQDPRPGIKKAVQDCIFQSGGTDGATNTILDEQIAQFDKYGINWVPRITINNEKYHGNLLCPHPVDVSSCGVFAAICAGFAPETIPDICNTVRSGCPLGEERDRCGVCDGDGSSCYINASKGMAAFVVIIVIVLVVVIAMLIYLRRRFQQSEDQFDALRSMYEPLRDSEAWD